MYLYVKQYQDFSTLKPAIPQLGTKENENPYTKEILVFWCLLEQQSKELK